VHDRELLGELAASRCVPIAERGMMRCPAAKRQRAMVVGHCTGVRHDSLDEPTSALDSRTN